MGLALSTPTQQGPTHAPVMVPPGVPASGAVPAAGAAVGASGAVVAASDAAVGASEAAVAAGTAVAAGAAVASGAAAVAAGAAVGACVSGAPPHAAMIGSSNMSRNKLDGVRRQLLRIWVIVLTSRKASAA